MAYTDAQIDAKLALQEKQIRLKAPAADLSRYVGQNSTRVQTAQNNITTLQADITDLQRQNASLTNRLLDTQTVSVIEKFVDPTVGSPTQIAVFQTPSAMNISTIRVWSDATSTTVQVLNDSQNVLTGALTGVASTWISDTGLQNIGTTSTGSIEMIIDGVTGAQTVMVQVDLTV